MKKFFLVVLVLVIGGIITGLVLWNKPHQKVENTEGVLISAVTLQSAFSKNEAAADSLYLNKAIQVSGTVAETDKNKDGGLMIVLQTGDPVAGIECTMRDTGAAAPKGQAITIKGFCSGYGITGVTLTDCIFAK